MVKSKIIYLLIIILLTNCGRAEEFASDEQINWCISKASTIDKVTPFDHNTTETMKTEITFLVINWDTAVNRVKTNKQDEIGGNNTVTHKDVLGIKNSIPLPSNIFNHYRNVLVDEREGYLNALEICKIWEEISN